MTSYDLESVAQTLVAEGKGILAADETVPTLTRRFDTLGIQSTEQSRRAYREMLFTSPGAAEFFSGVIMYDETIRQKSSVGAPLTEALASFRGSRSIPARSRLRALVTRPLRRDLTVYGIACRNTGPWVPVSRSGGPLSVSPTLYLARAA
jgi:Fructose-bisphosphate aldolase class-I